ncbi:hypothetical protein BDW22DRAFT_376903 [Trametopsis cervina]|nr:hypothetical protein BDW22DRAFT_376903 [Trametopsis cervina]
MELAVASTIRPICSELSSTPRRKQYGVVFRPPLEFKTPQGGPFLLAAALGDHIEDSLSGSDVPIFSGSGTKYSIIIQFAGLPQLSRQKYAHDKSGPNTVGKVARQVAEVMLEYIDKNQNYDTWQSRYNNIAFENIYLLRMTQVSKASFQCEFGIAVIQ